MCTMKSPESFNNSPEGDSLESTPDQEGAKTPESKPEDVENRINAEITPNARQQDKIIKIIESGDTDIVGQQFTTVSDAERNSFFEKVRTGEITKERLNNEVILNIDAPFIRRVEELHEELHGNEKIIGPLRDVVRSGLYGTGGREREHLPDPEELSRFVQMYPTPYSFDREFAGNRLQKLREELEQEQSPERRAMLEKSISLQEYAELETYPRLRQALYGKRNEYWDQIKLLLNDGPLESGPETARGDESPEFDERRIDKERLRSAIEIALEGEPRAATTRVAEERARESAERTAGWESLGEGELREEIRRAEARGDEGAVLQLESLLFKREDERRARGKDAETLTGGSPYLAAARTAQAERQAREAGAAEESQSPEAPSPEAEIKEEMGGATEKLKVPTWLRERIREKDIASRRSEMAREGDPIGVAKSALREALEESGVSEATYLNAGPYELLSSADKLAVVRAHAEMKRKNPWSSAREQEMYLKGLVYGAYEKVHGEGAASVETESQNEVREREAETREVASEVAGGAAEAADANKENPAEAQAAGVEQSPREEDFRGLEIHKSLRETFEDLTAHIDMHTGEGDIEAARKRKEVLRVHYNNIWEDDERGEAAREFLWEVLNIFMQDEKVKTSKNFPKYRAVREMLRDERGTIDSDKAA